ncbi:MAG: NADH-quinone oxidoreductase subunit J [Sphingomonadales bacterium]
MTPALIEALLFYLFAFMTLGAAWFVVRAANPVHSVLYLIFAFFNTAALFLLLGAEFLAMIQIIVYVGAVAVLFLFVVMMLNINFTEIRENLARYWVIGFLLGMVLLAELIAGISSYQYAPEAWRQAVANPIPGGVSNTEALGVLMYTDYIYAFQAAGLILLVAMIGAIVLTHRKRKGVKKQNITQQIRRTAKDAIEVKKIEPGEGV